MGQRVPQLPPRLRTEVRSQRDAAGVETPVVCTAERHHAVGRIAAAQPPRHQVRGVDRHAFADQAAESHHLEALAG
jgi:hypothetical protein